MSPTVGPDALPLQPHRVHAAVAAGAALVFTWVLLRTAWLCDDAFITLRTIDNFVNGYGLRWNVAERVQAFTHPAWLLVLTPVYAITREPYYTTLAVQGLLAVATLYWLAGRVALNGGLALVAAAVVLGSKALVDFSTSGLENPLTHVALLGFFLAWRRDRPGPSRLRALGWLTSLALLCRQDLVLLLGPALVVAVWRSPRPWLRPLALGLSPLVAWEVFTFLYYGALLPNTALAKLTTGIGSRDLLVQGWSYWVATFRVDPFTVVALVVAGLALAVGYGRAGRVVSAGAALYLLYLLRVGGDFMSGRFFTPVLFWVLLGLVGLPAAWHRRARPWMTATAAAVLLGAGLLAPVSPPLLSGPGFGAAFRDDPDQVYLGVSDERRFYYPALGLWRRLSGEAETNPWAEIGRTVRDRTTERQVIAANNVGLFGYYAGPTVHVIDRYALGDPFLARLPARHPWRIGHFAREIPDGYVETWRTSSNQITDPDLRAFYDRLRVVTQGSVWSVERLPLILRSSLGLLGP